MLFQKEHIEMIRNGQKTATRRVWKRWHVKVGGTYPAQSYMYQPRKECPITECHKRYLQRLGDMCEEDANKEGGYTLEEFKQVWIDINGEWNPDITVHVVEFGYIGEGVVENGGDK